MIKQLKSKTWSSKEEVLPWSPSDCLYKKVLILIWFRLPHIENKQSLVMAQNLWWIANVTVLQPWTAWDYFLIVSEIFRTNSVISAVNSNAAENYATIKATPKAASKHFAAFREWKTSHQILSMLPYRASLTQQLKCLSFSSLAMHITDLQHNAVRFSYLNISQRSISWSTPCSQSHCCGFMNSTFRRLAGNNAM